MQCGAALGVAISGAIRSTPDTCGGDEKRSSAVCQNITLFEVDSAGAIP